MFGVKTPSCSDALSWSLSWFSSSSSSRRPVVSCKHFYVHVCTHSQWQKMNLAIREDLCSHQAMQSELKSKQKQLLVAVFFKVKWEVHQIYGTRHRTLNFNIIKLIWFMYCTALHWLYYCFHTVLLVRILQTTTTTHTRALTHVHCMYDCFYFFKGGNPRM